MKLSRIQEDVISQVYRLSMSGGKARISDIAFNLNKSKSRIVQIAKKLADMGLIKYNRYGGLELTEKGRRVAETIIRTHRLLELFLVNILGLDVIRAHEIAHELEHVSGEMIEKISDLYDEDNTCPHGNPVNPSVHLNDVRLLDLNEGELGVINRVSIESPEILRVLIKNSIWLNKKVKVIRKTKNLLIIDVEGKWFIIPTKMSRFIYVRSSKDES